MRPPPCIGVGIPYSANHILPSLPLCPSQALARPLSPYAIFSPSKPRSRPRQYIYTPSTPFAHCRAFLTPCRACSPLTACAFGGLPFIYSHFMAIKRQASIICQAPSTAPRFHILPLSRPLTLPFCAIATYCHFVKRAGSLPLFGIATFWYAHFLPLARSARPLGAFCHLLPKRRFAVSFQFLTRALNGNIWLLLYSTIIYHNYQI